MSLQQSTEIYNVRETCARLGGISRRKFYELVNTGELKTFKIGKRRMISKDALADFIQRREASA